MYLLGVLYELSLVVGYGVLVGGFVVLKYMSFLMVLLLMLVGNVIGGFMCFGIVNFFIDILYFVIEFGLYNIFDGYMWFCFKFNWCSGFVCFLFFMYVDFFVIEGMFCY